MADISYNVIVRPRRKSIGIVVRANNEIDVLAPPRVPATEIARLVSSKSDWIRKRQRLNREIRERHRPKSFTDGETFNLTGRSLTLRLEAGRRAIHLKDDTLLVRLPRYEPEQRLRIIRRHLIDWYRQQALEHLRQRTAHFAPLIGRHPSHLGIKGYRSRWGSCHRDGRIYFNWRLVMAPPSVIDYVVVHELCHLIHHNHSPAYWQLVESVLPHSGQARQWLKINGLALEL